jgi:hypothetical protein
MNPGRTILATLFIASAVTRAQVIPEAEGPALPVSGTLHYDLHYSQTAQFYRGSQGDAQSSVLSGDVAYMNASQVRPFSLTYSGGDRWNISGGSYGRGYFQHLLVSQGVLRRNWSFNLSDDASLMPQTPTTGFSGIPGVGSLPSEPAQPSQQILTLNTRSIYNMVNSSFTRSLDHATSLGIDGSYSILRFPNGGGLESSQLQLSPQVTWRLNALNSIFCQYSYSRFRYPGYSIVTQNQSVSCGLQRIWNRRLKTSISAGPQRVTSTSGAGVTPTTGLFLNATAGYQARSASATLGYLQTATGSGGALIAFGTRIHDVNAELARQFGRNMTLSASGAYMRTQSLMQINIINLQLSGVTNGEFGGVSASRRLGRYINVNANYTATRQSSNSALQANAIRGLSQVIGFGIGYSPREMHFRK